LPESAVFPEHAALGPPLVEDALDPDEDVAPEELEPPLDEALEADDDAVGPPPPAGSSDPLQATAATRQAPPITPSTRVRWSMPGVLARLRAARSCPLRFTRVSQDESV
jgi:hypothetical protein